MTIAARRGARWFGGHTNDRSGLWIGLLVSLLVATASPALAADVAVRVRESNRSYRVEGTLRASAPVATAWAVLTDYERIGAFVSSVRSNVFVPAPDGRRVLRQDATAGVFPFRRELRVELALREEPRERIEFVDVLGRDFVHYSGSWTLRADSAGTTVVYRLDAEPRVEMPGFVGRGFMSRGAGQLLAQVRAEILRRESGGSPDSNER